jgi:regulator of protease activity HflC (stomatin/prohibitin superfamily)
LPHVHKINVRARISKTESGDQLKSTDLNSDRNRRLPAFTRLRWLIVISIFGVLAYIGSPLAIVSAGQRGVLTTMGKPSEEVYSEGVHFIVPFVQEMHSMDVHMAKNEGQGEAASKDLQAVQVKVILNYHLDPAATSRVFKEIASSTDEVAARVIDPARPEAVKAVTARFTAEELITRRTEVRDQIAALLREKMMRHGLILDEFAIVNFSFSQSFAGAIEAKVRAEQEKLKADRDLQRIQVEAEQRIASARAEAEGLRLQRQEVTPLLLQLRRVENERMAIAKWNGQLPTTSIGGATQSLINLPSAALSSR